MRDKKPKPQSVADYGFTGVFIPAHIWLSDKIKRNEVLLLVQIDALDNLGGCTASNEWLADTLDLGVRRVQQMISKFIGLELVDRELNGPNRRLRINREVYATFDREPTMQKIACRGRNKLQGNHAINCTQGEKERKEKEVSPSEIVEGREPDGSAPSVDSGPSDRGNTRGGPPAPTAGAARSAVDGSRRFRQPQNKQSATKTPQDAPWKGVRYSGMTQDDLIEITHHDEIWRFQHDPIFAAMCVTKDISPGGYGFWIKWLNSMVSRYEGIDDVIYCFVDLLSRVHAENDHGGVRSMAAVFNTELKKIYDPAVPAPFADGQTHQKQGGENDE